MSREPDDQEESLQHLAEHEKPPAPKGNVMSYLLVLFAAAFLLLLMTYFMQQRTSQETIDGLKQSMNTMTAIKSIEELQAENESLQAQLSDLQAQVEALTTERDAAHEMAQAGETERHTAQSGYDALMALTQLRAYYNQRRYGDAREYLASWNGGNLEEALTALSQSLTEEERALYDPLKAFQTICAALY